MSSLTSVNASIVITVPGVAGSPCTLSEFSAENILDTEELDMAEISMSLDGVLSAAFVFNEVKQGFHLQANSASIAFFDAWKAAEFLAVDKLHASGSISLKGAVAGTTKYNMPKGFLKGYPPMADLDKTQKARKFTIVWERLTPA